MEPRRPEYQRSSSFARSFFQAAGDGETADGATSSSTPGPTSMRRQRSRRRLSRGSAGSGDKGLQSSVHVALQGMVIEEHPDDLEGSHSEIPMPSPISENTRQASWYTDALMQSQTGDLAAFLHDSPNGAAAHSSSKDLNDSFVNNTPDDEVLEQYQMMAHIEASIRVKDNIGFDMEEYEQRRKLYPEPAPGEINYYTGENKRKPPVPSPKIPSPTSVFSPSEPPLAWKPPSTVASKALPECAVGTMFSRTSHQVAQEVTSVLSNGDHIIRCLGCKQLVQTHLRATMVQCPECATVGPATSVRR
eukprot:Nitzschia sp. Nitz4//scaffold255_size41878//23192//24103//NITZ4_007406-RA/size41878-processed-gene-0.21-mRNA-1//-1//CDS//3329544374//8396//frame0